ncbi:hypothetical protein M413DRAFT_70737 [Hebeloma cylindrosporum]|uniref:Uncharacterized protein n=1 Tax=Hebeloma cylindrosporum TaxID=76867 RepID=A0A0C3C0J8_HEBCY|nr:hypothetical protein M413DRAFT_70737 [Hebeloma cylindrosporum h7]
MEIMYKGDFSEAALATYRPIVYSNVLLSAQDLVTYLRESGLKWAESSNEIRAKKVLAYRLPENKEASFPREIAEAIHELWKDPIMPEFMEKHARRSAFCLMDSAAYFFREVLRISSQGYIPSQVDILRAHRRSIGIYETRLAMDPLSVQIFDVGGLRSERRMWIHCFDSINMIIFCAALSEYNQVLLEDYSQNRLEESLQLFETIINSRWFTQTSIVLFLNKVDLFTDKLPNVPLVDYFPDYQGGSDVTKATKYILSKFLEANRSRLTIYTHLTIATDITNMAPVLSAVKETIHQNPIRDSLLL